MKKIYGITRNYTIVESEDYETENIGTHSIPFISYRFKEQGIDLEETDVSNDYETIKKKLNDMLDIRIKTIKHRIEDLQVDLKDFESKIIK